MRISRELEISLALAVSEARRRHHEFLCIEHVLYALLRTKAHIVARLVLLACLLAMGLTGNLGWSLMLMLLVITGPDHPPTADDDVPLGTGRIILGWATLLFLIIGFTPTPFSFA